MEILVVISASFLTWGIISSLTAHQNKKTVKNLREEVEKLERKLYGDGQDVVVGLVSGIDITYNHVYRVKSDGHFTTLCSYDGDIIAKINNDSIVYTSVK